MSWSHTISFLHLTLPAVQLSFLFHSSAVSYLTNDMFWLKHLLILLYRLPSVLPTSNKRKSNQLLPNTILHFLIFFPLVFMDLLILVTSRFIAPSSNITCKNRWGAGIMGLMWKYRYKACCGQAQSWLCAPAACLCSYLLNQHQGRAHMATVQLCMHFGISPKGFKCCSQQIFTRSTLEIQAVIQKLLAECVLIAMSWNVKTEMSQTNIRP